MGAKQAFTSLLNVVAYVIGVAYLARPGPRHKTWYAATWKRLLPVIWQTMAALSKGTECRCGCHAHGVTIRHFV